jgi:putative transposase
VIHRAFRFRLYPTDQQSEAMAQTAHVCRFLWNLALEQRRDWWRQARAKGITLNAITQGREVTELRAEYDWLAAVHSTPLTQVLRDLDRAFANYFCGQSRFPRFRDKDRSLAFRHKAREVSVRPLNSRWSLVRVPKVGWVKLRHTRPIRGEIVSATFCTDALGWHVSFACEIPHEAPAPIGLAVGIDRGVANTPALSTGELLSTPCTAALDRRKKRAQRVLARRKRGSNRYRKQRIRLCRINAKLARVRGGWQHRASTAIAERFGHVGLEALKTKNMTLASRGLARSILEQGWQGFEWKLAYKLEERGGTLVKVNPAYTSQECSDCGTIDRASRESQASFACRHCGFAAHADTNAAINILRRSTACVEGVGCGPYETRTGQRLAA